jgi:hypothetical protein
MGHAVPTTIVSHWNQMIPGLQQLSAKGFYDKVEAALAPHNLNNVKLERINLSEGGLLSAKREYLQIRRTEHVFHVCAAPFGNGFFISWWLGQIESGLWAWLSMLPFIGPIVQRFIKPITYYKIDTALMFQSVTHGALLQALDGITEAKGLRSLTETERKPVMRDFFARIGG